MLCGPRLSLSTQQHPEEEAALSLRTGTGEDEAEQVKVTESREGVGKGGGRKNMTLRRCTDDKSLHWGGL